MKMKWLFPATILEYESLVKSLVYVLHENPEILDDPGEHLLN